MADNYKENRLLADNGNHFIVQKPDGTHFPVAKSGLDPLTIQKISKFKPAKMSDGGGVPDPTAGLADQSTDSPPATPVIDPTASFADQSTADSAATGMPIKASEIGLGNKPELHFGDTPPLPSLGLGLSYGKSDKKDSTPTSPPASADARSVAASVDTPPPAPSNPITDSAQSQMDYWTNEQNKIKAFAQQEHNYINAEGGAWDNYAKSVAAMPTYQTIADNYKKSNDEFQKNYVDSNMTAPGIFSDKSFPQQLFTGLAVLIGGAGAGVTGGENQGLKVVNDQIQREMSRQQNDQSKKMNLWKMNREKMNSDQDANLATQNQLLSVAQAQAKRFATLAKDPDTQMRYQQLSEHAEIQKQQNRLRLGINQAPQPPSFGAANGFLPQDPASLVNVLPIPEHQKENTLKEISEAQTAQSNKSQFLDLFDKAATQNTALKTGFGMLREPPAIINMMNLAGPLLHDKDGRQSPEIREAFKQGLPRPGDLAETINEKRKGLINFIDSKSAAPTAKANGIDLSRFVSTSTDPRARFNPLQAKIYSQAISLLKQNPNDPKGNLALKQLGIK